MDSQMKGILETQDLVVALSVVLIRTRSNLADGKISYLEMLGYLNDVPELKKAITGIQSVPAELLDLTDAEVDVLGREVSSLLVGMGLKHRTGDVTTHLLRGVSAMVRSIVNILNLPPVPDVVVE